MPDYNQVNDQILSLIFSLWNVQKALLCLSATRAETVLYNENKIRNYVGRSVNDLKSIHIFLSKQKIYTYMEHLEFVHLLALQTRLGSTSGRHCFRRPEMGTASRRPEMICRFSDICRLRISHNWGKFNPENRT